LEAGASKMTADGRRADAEHFTDLGAVEVLPEGEVHHSPLLHAEAGYRPRYVELALVLGGRGWQHGVQVTHLAPATAAMLVDRGIGARMR